MPYCPNCLYEYREGYTKCTDCGAELVPELPEAGDEEIVEKRIRPWETRLLRFFSQQVDTRINSRRMEALCWALMAATLMYLIIQSAQSIDIYFNYKPWEMEQGALFSVAVFFSICFPSEAFLTAIMVLFLSLFLMRPGRLILLRAMTCIATFLALWRCADLVLSTTLIVKNDALREVTVMGTFITGIVALAILVLIGVASAIYSLKLGKRFPIERLENV